MAEKKVSGGTRKLPPAQSPEELEKRNIHLAEERAAKMLEEGTAPTSILLHYLKLGTSKAELEKAKLENETKLLTAKTEALESAKDVSKMMEDVMNCIKGYGITAFNENSYDEE